ncbi:MAG: SDR family oxidoreductase [Sphingobium sp.]|nr:SDR family oxidoreductase [Sphingobium sp.]
MKRVLVTGGAAGIGRAIAERFVAAGDRVLTCDVDAAELEAAKSAMPGLLAIPCDVSDPIQVDMLFAALARDLGGLDVLVANVGIGGPTLPADELPLADWQRVMDVNLTGTFDVTRRAIPLLKQSKGTIVIMSSAAGRLGYPNRMPYAVSKWGLVGMAKTLAAELGEFGISANAILPGAVGGERFERVIEGRAALSGRAFEDEMMAGFANQSLKQVAEPAHVADLVHFLTTPAGRSISGAALPIDNDLHRG